MTSTKYSIITIFTDNIKVIITPFVSTVNVSHGAMLKISSKFSPSNFKQNRCDIVYYF